MKTKDGKVAMEDFFIDRLNYIMQERHLSRYKLERVSGVAQASLSTILKGSCAPSLHTLDRIIEGLDMTAEEFFKDELPPEVSILTSEERHMLDLWRKMKHTDKMMIYAFAQGLEAKAKSVK